MGLFVPEEPPKNVGPEDGQEELLRDSEIKDPAGMVKATPPKGWPYDHMHDEGYGTSADMGGGGTFDELQGPEGMIRKLKTNQEAALEVDHVPGAEEGEFGPTIVERTEDSEDALGSIPEEEGDAEVDALIRQLEAEREGERLGEEKAS